MSVSATGPAAWTRPSRRRRACVVDAGSSSRWCVVTTTASSGSASATRARAARSSSRPGQVEAGPRLVEEQQPRLGDERPGDQGPLALAFGAVAEPALGQAPEAEPAEQRVRAVDVEHREPLLEVADRSGRTRPNHLTHRQERREAVSVAGVDEPDLPAQARDVGAPHRLAEDLDRAAAREPGRPREREQGRLAGTVRPEHGPALAGAHGPGDAVEQELAGAARLVPAPDLHVPEAECSRGLTRLTLSTYTY